MQLSLKLKTILAASLALLIIACNNDKPKKVKVQEITLQDIKQEEKHIEPPPPPPPRPEPQKVELKDAITKCFVNEGLKYKITVTLGFNESKVLGIVSSEEIESGKKRSTGFKGTRKNDEFTIEFIGGKPPVIGDASEWINKSWTLKKEGGKEILHITFNAKNYDTNKWEDVDYQFTQVDCK